MLTVFLCNYYASNDDVNCTNSVECNVIFIFLQSGAELSPVRVSQLIEKYNSTTRCNVVFSCSILLYKLITAQQRMIDKLTIFVNDIFKQPSLLTSSSYEINRNCNLCKHSMVIQSQPVIFEICNCTDHK